MSNDIRQALADAANTVTGVHVSQYYKQLQRRGEGGVIWSGWTRDASGFGFMETWTVVVVLPNDLDRAEAWIDEFAPALVEALDKEIEVTDVSPTTRGAGVPCIEITGTRAAAL